MLVNSTSETHCHFCVGRNSKEENLAEVAVCFDHMEQQLGNNTFWLGDKISSIDRTSTKLPRIKGKLTTYIVTAYGFFSAVLEVKIENDLKDALLKREVLVNYFKRMEELVWGKPE